METLDRLDRERRRQKPRRRRAWGNLCNRRTLKLLLVLGPLLAKVLQLVITIISRYRE